MSDLTAHIPTQSPSSTTSVIETSVPVTLPPKPNKNKKLIISSMSLLIIIVLLIRLFLYLNNLNIVKTSVNNTIITTSIPTTIITTSTAIPTSTQVIWPTVSLKDTVLFIGKNYPLSLANSKGNNVKSLSAEINDAITDVSGAQISPDNNKMLVSGYDSSRNSYDYIISLDGSLNSKLDLTKVTTQFGKQYEITSLKWMRDSNRIAILIRDNINLVGQRADGFDSRKSDQKVLVWNIADSSIKEIFSVNSSAINVTYVDDLQGVLIYDQTAESSITVVDLKTSKTTTKPIYIGGAQYTSESANHAYITDDKTIKIYDVKDLNTPISQLKITEGNFDSIKWSNDGKYIATFLSGTNNDNVKIFDAKGNLTLSTKIISGDRTAVFSKDNRYILLETSEHSTDSSCSNDTSSNCYNTYWRLIDLNTKKDFINKFTNKEIGAPIFMSI